MGFLRTGVYSFRIEYLPKQAGSWVPTANTKMLFLNFVILQDYELQLASYTSGLETLLNIPIKRTMVQSPSGVILQEVCSKSLHISMSTIISHYVSLNVCCCFYLSLLCFLPCCNKYISGTEYPP